MRAPVTASRERLAGAGTGPETGLEGARAKLQPLDFPGERAIYFVGCGIAPENEPR